MIDNTIGYGDIVRIQNRNYVVVSTSNNDNILFAATIDAFIRVESSGIFTYSYGNSGWYEISPDIKKIGHITLFKE